MIPAIREEIRMTGLVLLIKVSWSKASRVIKIDMVNPIPPKKPVPMMVFQFSFSQR